MAKCDLSIELDDAGKDFAGGDKITGVVRVHVDADVRCKGLEVSSVWRTHGRGNIATGTAGSLTVFSGEWRAGESPEYRFELPVANWPPTYHGHYLSIDHYVDARAKIPWGFDPKASESFVMRPRGIPEQATDARSPTEIKGIFGCIALVIFFGFAIGLIVMLMAAGPFVLIFLAFPLLGGVYWFIRSFLPKYLLGDVEYQLLADHVSPGASVTGELVVRPRKNVSINGITLQFQAREQCVSGSGSNRTTHKNVLFENTTTLQAATTLTMGKEHRFNFAIEIPENAPYTVDLDDNELIWSAALRVDIPRWPDWTKELPIHVVPSGELVVSDDAGVVVGPAREIDASTPLAASPRQAELYDDGITFAETANHLWSVRDHRDQVESLVEAVSGLTFELDAVVERRLLYGGDDDPHVYKDGYAVWAHYVDPPLPMVLYVPHELADDFEHAGREAWRGRGTVVGWDSLHGRLQVKLERDQ